MFYSLSLPEFNTIVAEYIKKEDDKFKRDWERTRQQTAWLLYPYASKGKIIKPFDIQVFSWEEEEYKKMQEEEARKLERADKLAEALKTINPIEMIKQGRSYM